MSECACEAPEGGEHYVTCPVYEPPLSYDELRQLRTQHSVWQPPQCDHEFVDRIVRLGGWTQMTKLVIYCKRCGKVSAERFIG